jgi:Phosphoesterase family
MRWWSSTKPGSPMRKVVLFGLLALGAAFVLPSIQLSQAAGVPPHVMIVLMENTSYEGVVGNSQMPYVNGLVSTNGSVSTADLSHPSLPNYLGLISGSIQNNPPDTTPQDGTYAGSQFTDELAAAGIAWKAYMQDMPVACDLTDQFGPANYDVNHNPFMYFDSVRNNPSQCNRDVPYPQLAADLSSGVAPAFIWVSPNIVNDMHNGTPAQGDAFLQGLVTQVEASSWWTAGSRIVITWDEGTTSEQVLTLVVGSAHGTAATAGSAYGTLRGLEEAFGVGLLGHSADSNVGDILPLLSGSTSPPPPSPTQASSSPPASPSPAPSPTPSTTPSRAPSASPTPSRGGSASPSSLPAASSSPSPSVTGGAYVRGVYGKDSSHGGFDTIGSTGFNTVMSDPYTESLDPLTARGLKGVVWLGAWLNAPSCRFEDDDTKIRSLVTAIAGNPAILAYYLGDEPLVSQCPAAPAMFKQRTALVHSLDPGSKTFTVIQQYEGAIARDYAPWAGAVDILGFDIYPCSKGNPCDFGAIDVAIASISAAGITNYWAVVQDFQDCFYRLPTPQELRSEFDHWAGSGMTGYFVFSWNYQSSDSTCVGTSLDSHPDNLAVLKSENARTFIPASGPPLSPSAPAAKRTLAGYILSAGWIRGMVIGAALIVLIALGVVAARRRLRSKLGPDGRGD